MATTRSTPAESRTTGTPDQAQREGMDKVADPAQDAAGRGAGLPAQPAQTERTPTDSPFTPKEASIKSSIRLPHERDEDADITNETDTEPGPLKQAARDLEHGLKDTSRANETDQAYHRLHKSAEPPGAPAPEGTPAPQAGPDSRRP